MQARLTIDEQILTDDSNMYAGVLYRNNHRFWCQISVAVEIWKFNTDKTTRVQ